jgi:hemoglobin-like flavoprotein
MSFLSDLFGGTQNSDSKFFEDSYTKASKNTDTYVDRTAKTTNRTGASGSDKVTKGSEFIRTVGQNVIMTLPEIFNQFSKQNAVKDSEAAMKAAMDQVLASGLPDIRTDATVAGGYNSTTTKLLQDNLFAQAAAAGAKVQLDTVNQYAGVGNELIAAMNQLLGMGLEADVTNTFAEDTVDSQETIENGLTREAGMADEFTQSKGTGRQTQPGDRGKFLTDLVSGIMPC